MDSDDSDVVPAASRLPGRLSRLSRRTMATDVDVNSGEESADPNDQQVQRAASRLSKQSGQSSEDADATATAGEGIFE